MSYEHLKFLEISRFSSAATYEEKEAKNSREKYGGWEKERLETHSKTLTFPSGSSESATPSERRRRRLTVTYKNPSTRNNIIKVVLHKEFVMLGEQANN